MGRASPRCSDAAAAPPSQPTVQNRQPSHVPHCALWHWGRHGSPLPRCREPAAGLARRRLASSTGSKCAAAAQARPLPGSCFTILDTWGHMGTNHAALLSAWPLLCELAGGCIGMHAHVDAAWLGPLSVSRRSQACGGMLRAAASCAPGRASAPTACCSLPPPTCSAARQFSGVSSTDG